ncbi:IclR family transcriptional regulator [Saccharopolyspora sp. HNM0983]|uniref:IclR family transcriptional regulator n=1 Tax=Saccharopolyspora montiporae TaxID=2781240 RepID=A0A929B9Z9_9PSEU|nr:IclR family transcriptional regulator [Saccharopolyspora sp. HNM0983]MBE9376034.1 IclR family transcriptional regulator [Saccharopolyspora sp. HNM0983]
MARSPSGESVLTRIVRVLDAFDADNPALGVSDIARRADLPLATAHRLVGELVGYGFLERSADRRVRVGYRMWELAARSSQALALREAAMPFMEDLHAVIRQHTQLAVLCGDDVLFVERLSVPDAVVNATRIAGRLPAHACSSGLVLLAHADPAVQERFLDGGRLPRFTPNTVADPAKLRRVLADVRREGHCAADEMFTCGAAGVAVPVHDGAEQVRAALSVVVPAGGNHRALVPALRTASRGISRAVR